LAPADPAPTSQAGLNSNPFVTKTKQFEGAYEDTNIVGEGLITKMSLSRVETTDFGEKEATITYVANAVTASLDQTEVVAKYGNSTAGTVYSSLVITFSSNKILTYTSNAPVAGDLLGKLGGLSGLISSLWVGALLLVLYIDKFTDPHGKYDLNRKGGKSAPNQVAVKGEKGEKGDDDGGGGGDDA
jgi:hypothetical protein